MSNIERDYYCNFKFKFLKVDLTKTTIYTCDAAKPTTIDIDWLKSNPGQLFNNETTVQDRRLMLQNIRNPNCEQNCWPAEDKGSVSPRLHRCGNVKTHTDIILNPEIIDLTTNSECNLSCSYCCKEYSSSWRRDIIQNGDYKITDLTDRYQLTNKDRIMAECSQNEIRTSNNYQLLLEEIKIYAPTLKKLIVTGGEPLLDNHLVDSLASIPFNTQIEINMFSGLGLSMSRFVRVLDNLELLSNKYENFSMKISAENTGKFYEFNRYGNTWLDFQAKVELLRQRGIKFNFHGVISNLTLFGYSDFVNIMRDTKVTVDFVHQPHMLAPHVLDKQSKNILREQIKNLDNENVLSLLKSIDPIPTEIERLNLKEFLLEFTRRRPDLSLTIFPESFLKWIE